ncbi:metalloregulator ArsR/SmtB family transcription factor [Marinobacterium zhoushanense]|nr:metalloregulator ArsR/SmtB family transcription factor [Marinobacterium zhoushanense]
MSSDCFTPIQFFKSLADELRLKSLLLIEARGELCVCELMQALDESQPKVSRHLAQLRRSGLLLDRRQGQWVFYRLHPEAPRWMVDVLRRTREHNPQLLTQPESRLRAMTDRPSDSGRLCQSGAAG